MKQLFFVLVFLISFINFAQDSTNVKAETPKIVSRLEFGKVLQVDDVELKFVEVLSDSRCPKNVTCIWAGEAVVLVDVYKNGKKLEQKKLTFNPSSQLQNQFANLFASENLNISAYNVSPYPVYKEKIKPEDYYIQLEVKN